MTCKFKAEICQWKDGSYGAVVEGLPRDAAELSADDLEILARQLLVAADQIKAAQVAGRRVAS